MRSPTVHICACTMSTIPNPKASSRLQMSDKLVRPQYGFFDDKVGPVTLCVLIMVALTAILIMAILDYVHG